MKNYGDAILLARPQKETVKLRNHHFFPIVFENES